MIHYTLITDTSVQNQNPGDILIGGGIEFLLREFERQRGNRISMNKVDIFIPEDEPIRRCDLESDVVVLCGTPQAGYNIPAHLDREFYDRMSAWKGAGKKLLNLWAGLCWIDYRLSRDECVDEIVQKNGAFIKETQSLFHLIVARDSITQEVLRKLEIASTQLLDCVSYNPGLYAPCDVGGPLPRYSVLGIKKVNEVDTIVDAVMRAREALLKEAPENEIRIVVHDITDLLFYRGIFEAHPELVQSLECVNQPHDLVEIYKHADCVFSMRVHGSVLAANAGAKVCNIRMDSRSDILEYFGLKSPLYHDFIEGKVDFKFEAFDLVPRRSSDMEHFFDLIDDVI